VARLLLEASGMDRLLRKYLWTIDLAALAACATFLAGGAASAMEGAIVLPTPPTHAAKTSAPRTRQPFSRNLFCSTCPALDAVATKAPLEAAPTPLPLSLVAVMYAPPIKGVDWSMAIVRDKEDGAIGAFVTGGKLRDATITRIEETRVALDRGGRREFLELRQSAPILTSTSAPAARTTDGLEGIRKTGPNSYEVERATLESLLGNMNLLASSARILPEVRDGQAGLRFASVRPDGPFARIGLQNGDLLSTVNGLDISKPEKAIDAYTKLRSASHISLGLERQGQKLTIEYSIR
jgi:general secretion pathway protein C